MKTFQMPILSMSLLGLCLLSGLDTPPVRADFTFGEPLDLKPIIPLIDVATDGIDCFSYDGLEMYSTTYVGPSVGAGNWDLRVLRRASVADDWGPPENLGPGINTIYVDADATISADGLTLYFNSNRIGGITGSSMGSDIYMATRPTKNAPWGPPVNLGPRINSAASDAFPWISADGLELYFGSSRAGGYGSTDIYLARRTTPNDPWGDPVNLGPVVNSAYTEGVICLSPDGLLMFFDDQYVSQVNHRPGGNGGCDIWMSRRASLSAPWQTPVNLGPRINKPVDDSLPRVSPDGRMLYFGSGSSEPATWVYYRSPILPIVDFNGDGNVDGKDVLCMVSHWGTNDPVCDIGPYAWGDGTVGLEDLTVLAEYMGKEVTDPTLVAHWALDETQGSTAHESVSGSGDIILGGPLWQPAGGQVDGAIQLDGLDDHIITTFALNPAKGPFSVLAWVKGGAPGQVVLSEPGLDNWLMAGGEGKLRTELKGSGRSDGPLQSQTVITDGKWHRIGLVWDGSRRSLYVDGVVAAEDTQGALPSSGNGLYIGTGKGMEPGSFWAGLIDDVRIYNRAVRP